MEKSCSECENGVKSWEIRVKEGQNYGPFTHPYKFDLAVKCTCPASIRYEKMMMDVDFFMHKQKLANILDFKEATRRPAPYVNIRLPKYQQMIKEILAKLGIVFDDICPF